MWRGLLRHLVGARSKVCARVSSFETQVAEKQGWGREAPQGARPGPFFAERGQKWAKILPKSGQRLRKRPALSFFEYLHDFRVETRFELS